MDYENLRANDGTGPAVLAHVDAPRSIGATTLVVDSVDNWPSKFICTTGPLLASGLLDPDNMTEFRGHLSGSDIIIDAFISGFSDIGNTTDDVAVIKPAGSFANGVVDLASISHNADGTLKDAIVAYNMLSANLVKGWLDANETWTYVSGTGTNTGVFKITGVDVTAKYQPGDRVKFTQTQVKYGIITKVALSGSDTQITVLMSMTSGTVDNSGLTNAAISANYYSRNRFPYGFPADIARWTIQVSSTSNRSPSPNTNFVSATDAITIPIGAWQFYYKGDVGLTISTATAKRLYITASSDASTETNTELTASIVWNSPSATTSKVGGTVSARCNLLLAAATTFTLMLKVGSSTTNVDSMALEGSSGAPTQLRAICAYF